MGEVLGISASLIAIIQLTGTVTCLGWGYISGVKRAPKDLRDLVDELNSLSKVLSIVQDLAADPNKKSTALQKLDDTNGPLKLCARDLEDLRLKLEPRGGFKGFMDNIAWPLKETDTLQYIARLERHKTLLIFALNADHMHLLREIGSNVQYMYSAVQDLRNDLDTKLATKDHVQDTYCAVQGLRGDIDTNFAALTPGRVEEEGRRIEEKRLQVLNWLCPEPFDKRHLDISRRRQKNTGEWLLKQSTFLEWIGGKLPYPLLWGHGIPGAGKTFLSSGVIDHILALKSIENYGIAYTYFEYQEQDSQRPINVISSLVKQLYTQAPSLNADLEGLYDRLVPKNKSPTFEELYTALVAIFKSFAQVFFVFDALDECHQENQREDLLPFFHQLLNDGANIFLTSRPHPEDIQEALNEYGASKIELSAREEDIGTYIEAKIERNARAKRLVRQGRCKDRIISELADCAKGMFLLVHFHITHLCQQTTAKQMLSELEKLKSLSNKERPLDTTYDRAIENLRRQPKSSTELALTIFSWLVNARRTLSVEEIRIAISIEQDRYDLDELGMPDKATLLDVCNGLVNIDDNGTIRLAHYTVKEYLLRNQVIPEDANFQIAMACATYLSFSVFAEGPCTSPRLLQSRLQLHPFLGYCSLNFSFHLASCNENLMTDAVLRFVQSSGSASSYIQILTTYSNPATGIIDCTDIDENYLWTVTTIDVPKPRHPLYISSAIGYSAAVQFLLDEGLDFSSSSVQEDMREALYIAASQGHERIVHILLDSGFGFSVPESEGCNPLWLALRRTQHQGVARLLIEGGADISVPDKSGKTLLHWAVILGRETIFQYLLEHRADLSGADNDGLTALHHAVCHGRNSMAQQLIKMGANIAATDKSGWTLIHWATFSRNKVMIHQLLELFGGPEPFAPIAYQDAIFNGPWSSKDRESVGLLLERLTDPSGSVPDKNGDTRLHRAAKYGRTESVELLLSSGASTSVPNKSGITPLMWAAAEGHDSVIKLLLASGAVLSDRDNKLRNALDWAVMRGRESTVSLLLNSGAGTCIVDKYGRTALHHAVPSPKNLGIVRLLLGHGADACIVDEDGYTALHLAVFSSGNLKIVKLLLDCGADACIVNKDGRTALHLAVLSPENLGVVKLLLDCGANTSIVDDHGLTALHLAASSFGNLATVKLLLDSGADACVLTANKFRTTALRMAAGMGSLDVVKVLLERGAKLSTRNAFGCTVLQSASSGGKNLVVNFLLDLGVDLDAQDNDGDTALHDAACRGAEIVVRTLLQRGADHSIPNYAGNTPLHDSANRNNPGVVRALLEAGADVLAMNTAGQTAMDVATMGQINEVIMVLRSYKKNGSGSWIGR